jgi:reactive intermediate/imine deaminase
MAKQVIKTSKIKLPPGLPFSLGVKKGNHVYVSGTTSFNESGEFVGEGDIYTQTIQTLQNVLAVVESAGGSIEDIAQINVFIKSASDFEAMNQAYKDFFGKVSFPSRTTIEANLVQERFLVEINAVAILD